MSPPTTPSPSVPLPARSTTAPQKAKHHHHPHPHRHHHTHTRDKSIPQSAIQLSSSNPFSGILSPIIGKSGDGGGGGSDGAGQSRTSQHARSQSAVAQVRREEEERARREKWGVVERMREGRRRGEGELRQSLHSLTTLSTTTTRRLDYTYYALLSHLSALTSTIADLRALSSSTATLLQVFKTESTDIAQEVTHQISAFDDFEAQSKRTKALRQRMEAGKEQVEALGQRLEKVRAKVEGWERVEGEWRVNVQRRVRMLWGFSGVVLGLVVLLLVIRHWPRAREAGPGVVGVGNLTVGRLAGPHVTLPAVKSVAVKGRGGEGGGVVRVREGDVDDHPAMRMLDEL